MNKGNLSKTDIIKPAFAVIGLMGALIVPSAWAAEDVSTLPDPLEAGWKGSSVCEKLHEDKEKRVLRCTFAPNIGHERHFHSPNYGLVVTGGRVKISDSTGTREVNLVLAQDM
jgi:hypothetical protein